MLNELIESVVQVLLFSLIPFLVWFITARKEGSFFGWIGFKKPACKAWQKTILLTVVVSLFYICLVTLSAKLLPEGVTTVGSQFAGRGISALPEVIFYAFLRTALSEEIFFRGFILKRVQDRAGFAVGNAAQAVLFGLMHGVPFGLITKSVFSFLLLTLLPGLMGWYQGWLNEKRCGGSIVPSWILHGCINFASGILSL